MSSIRNEVGVDALILLIILIAAICVAFLGFIFGYAVNSSSETLDSVNIVSPIATLLAAFAGSWYAFKLHHEKSKREKAASDVNAGNDAIFELIRWLNKLLNYKKQFLDEHRINSARHLLILPAAGLIYGNPKFDYTSLSFLFKSKDPNILGLLSDIEQQIISALDLIQQRSQIHVNIVQPAVEEVEKRIGVGSTFSTFDVEKEIGNRYVEVIKKLTNFTYITVDDGIERINKLIPHLKEQIEFLYPGHVVIGVKG